MSYFSSYTFYIGIAIVSIIVSIAAYVARAKYFHRHIVPYPMQVVVCPDAQYYPSSLPPVIQPVQYPQVCWSIPMEQPPPAYNTVVTEMNTNSNVIHVNNHS
ncbi:unnamed protein product [Adineta ricciae]|uniref:Uncharacterized protein n=1 Tax=Adineta ricciae TaxID=249248 RepID=A0A815EMN1_ADIRI|nr:unnamed protein product [Adineta ricciae]CAF1595938.1 unnamed protein product [Adineta ricciae]